MQLAMASAIIMTILSCYASGQEYAHLQVKAEHAFVISWDGISDDRDNSQITVSNLQGDRPMGLNVLRPVPDAKSVSVWDVSIRGNLVAVAAVYKAKEGIPPAHPVALLLLFDFGGRLLSAFHVDPARQVYLLAIDDQSNIWTLTDGGGTTVDPSTVPMVIKYSADGKVLKELLKHNLFPFHAESIRSDIEIGSPVMGYDSGVVWFWLPGSNDLVTIRTTDANTAIMKTQFPTRAGHKEVPLAIARESSGNLIAQVREDDDQLRPEVVSEVAYYRWSASTGLWSKFSPGACESSRLIGVSDAGQVYGQFASGRVVGHCVFRSQ